MRLLSVIRLSDLTDETTSPERQRTKNSQHAALHDHDIIGEAEDLDVSGAVDPFKRKGLGPWLTDPAKMSQWDALIVARIDRLTRSLFDFLKLWDWMQKQGKSLICIEPSLDMTTSTGRAFAQVLMTFAEYERETIAARVKDAYDKLRASGQYTGGQVPFGYMPVKLDGKGWGFEPDPEYGPVVAEMVRRYLAFQSLNVIARWLKDSGVPTSRNIVRIRNGKPPQPSEWKSTTVRKILASAAITGAMVDASGKPVRDADGAIIYRAEPLVLREDYDAVQARLKANGSSARVNASPLLQIAFCGECGAAMYVSVTRTSGKEYRYYHCRAANLYDGRCRAKRIKAHLVEECLAMALLDNVGDQELTEERLVPGRDYSEEMARAADTIGYLSSQIAIGQATGRDVMADQEKLKLAQEQLTRYAAMEPVQPRTEATATGETFRQRWERLDDRERNEFLRSAGVTSYAEQWDEEIDGWPMPDPDGKAVAYVGHGIRVEVRLGSLAKLRKLARQA
jgi:DNA invertase Pin-like site-specific DNA recombinase